MRGPLTRGHLTVPMNYNLTPAAHAQSTIALIRCFKPSSVHVATLSTTATLRPPTEARIGTSCYTLRR